MNAYTPEFEEIDALAALPDAIVVTARRHVGAHYRVFAARRDDTPVVVKVPLDAAAAESMAKMVRGLDHPGLPKWLEEHDTPSGPAVVLRWVDGDRLSDLVGRGVYRHDESFTTRLIVDAAEMLAYLHALRPPMLVRDLTPGSFVLDAQGGLHLVDLSSAIDDPRLLIEAGPAGVGTVGYTAAEQYELGRASFAADVHALAASFAHVLTGLPPQKIPRRNMAPDLGAMMISAPLADLLHRCMDVDAAVRPTASELAESARALLTAATSNTVASQSRGTDSTIASAASPDDTSAMQLAHSTTGPPVGASAPPPPGLQSRHDAHGPIEAFAGHPPVASPMSTLPAPPNHARPSTVPIADSIVPGAVLPAPLEGAFARPATPPIADSILPIAALSTPSIADPIVRIAVPDAALSTPPEAAFAVPSTPPIAESILPTPALSAPPIAESLVPIAVPTAALSTPPSAAIDEHGNVEFADAPILSHATSEGSVMSNSLGPSKGTVSVTTSYSVAASEKMSERASI